MKTKVEREPEQTPKPNLEQLVMPATFHQRDNCLAELLAGIARILQPRGGYYSYSGSENRHFLDIPPALKCAINKRGLPTGEVDPKELDALHAELEAITLSEQRLEAAAGKAKNQVEALRSWGGRIGEDEDMLLLAGAVLDEADRPAVMAYIAEHERYIRAVNRLTDGLRY